MQTGSIDLLAVVERLTARDSDRAEATVQSDLRMLLLAAGLNLRSENLEDVILEAPVGKRRRIDVEIGSTVFEVKRDLRAGNVQQDAVEQLAGYVRERVQQTGARYVGVLTDGVQWQLYHLDDGSLALVSSYALVNNAEGLAGLMVWLDGVMATEAAVIPTPEEVHRRLGATSPAFALDIADLSALYRRFRSVPGVAMKRSLWSKLLSTALGTSFHDQDELFIEHTLLVVTAEIIGHAVVGFDPSDPSLGAATMVRGQLFTSAQIRGVVEEDFFDWVIEVDGGASFVTTLARRLARFAWGAVEHDVMKVLYESVISAETRKSLGEYYTPDWLAESIVADVVTNPLEQRVMDPSCGSGTFVFHAVRRYLLAAEEAGHTAAQAITGVTSKVIGVDVHPVAVTLARVTYLLAIGRGRLQSQDRPAFAVPVYLGDSMQWGQNQTLLDSHALVVSTGEGATLFANELSFPERVVEDAGRFDALVSDLADAAARPGRPSAHNVLAAAFRRHVIHPDDQAMVTESYRVMCELHDGGMNHIWGYYLRNLARPVSLSQPGNQVDVLVGNPPWLSYRFLPAGMRDEFRMLSESRAFWAGAAVATHQDLSALFVARAVEQYLRPGGSFAFVMPLAVLTRTQYAGFRTGRWGAAGASATSVQFDQPWDLHAVKPSFFPVPACVVRGRLTPGARLAMPIPAQAWSGRVPGRNPSLAETADRLRRQTPDPGAQASAAASPYASRFSQGATLVPRCLLLVEEGPAGPLGAGAGRVAVHSRRSNQEKKPWKDLDSLTGHIERQFVVPTYVGDSVLPFRPLPPLSAVIPWDGTSLQKTVHERLDHYPGLADWWRRSTELWNQHGTGAMDLIQRLDYQRGLTNQLSAATHRVVYSKSGMYIAAAHIDDPRAVIDHALYWAAVTSADEARYLTAILNSDTLLQIVRPLQARGEHNPRHFDKYVWRAPIPVYDEKDQTHRQLVELAVRAENVAGSVELPSQSFQTQRRHVRQALSKDGVAAKIDVLTKSLLSSIDASG